VFASAPTDHQHLHRETFSLTLVLAAQSILCAN